MNIRFYNANILSMNGNADVKFGEVWVCDNTIIHVGDFQKNNIVWDKEYNLNGNLIMPGFKNAHSHSGMTFLRSFADDLPLQEWLNNRIFPMEAKISDEDIYHFSKLAILEYLTSGITANFDMYVNPHAIVDASVDMGFRTVVCGALNNYVQSLDLLDECYQKYNGHNELITYILGLHAEYTTSKELIEGVSSLAHKYQAPVYLHNSETLSEVKDCLQRNGLTPTTYLDSLGLFDYGGGGFHCVHMTDTDLNICLKHNLSVVTNPASNAKLASGIAPVSKMLAMGINVAIGTDGPASNNCLDMFREMFLVTALAKLREKDAAAVDGDDVLKMATVNGAKAMGLYNCDVIERGKLADLIVIDLNQPNMQPLNNITKNIVYSGSKQNVILTMVNGNVLYENGEFHIGEDPDQIYAEVNNRVERIKKN